MATTDTCMTCLKWNPGIGNHGGEHRSDVGWEGGWPLDHGGVVAETTAMDLSPEEFNYGVWCCREAKFESEEAILGCIKGHCFNSGACSDAVVNSEEFQTQFIKQCEMFYRCGEHEEENCYQIKISNLIDDDD